MGAWKGLTPSPFSAVANWIEKVCITIILLFSGLIIDLSGFDPCFSLNG